ncbi:thiamine phosphate synthase [Janthinobacterium psychrotolerans]|uniref:Thiamine-phosphate synthase n=1 Tax=Janthinobacterium psychrotolerans TaxID=1747903 RepID=A0A1A7BZX2_9BURK|nr:thiamine phosphate synthase [Janthinobacterium psychrotolerans]OBV39047.1 thiamine-phosphate pyrophosphorylase [Janthinobacterium psychrotolerans]
MRGLYLVTPNWDDTDRLLDVTEQAMQEGVALLQYRHKSADAVLRREQAGALQLLARKYGVPFIINDFIALCEELDADGLHVGGTDVSVAQARARLGAGKLVGASCYGDLLLARKVQSEGASYVAFGGFYPSLVKQYPVTTDPDIVLQAKREIALPCVVIGGMTPDNAAPLAARGADLVAAISSVYLADDVTISVRKFNELFGS